MGLGAILITLGGYCFLEKKEKEIKSFFKDIFSKEPIKYEPKTKIMQNLDKIEKRIKSIPIPIRIFYCIAICLSIYLLYPPII